MGPSIEASAAEVLGEHLTRRLSELRRLDPLARADAPDAVHRMRVACRRLRGTFASFRDFFDPEVTDPLRPELKWPIDELGRARDLEVLIDVIETLMEQQQVPARPMGCAPATQALREEHRRAHEHLVDAMTCPRYVALIASLQSIVDDPPWSPRAGRSARKVLPKAVAKDWRRVGKAAEAARTATPDERDARLHDVRKAAKRARYAAELIEPVVGKDAARFARLMTELQDSLGEHHDTVVARHRVVELADPAFGSAIDPRECEVLLNRLADAGRQAYEAYQVALDRAARPKHHRWLG